LSAPFLAGPPRRRCSAVSVPQRLRRIEGVGGRDAPARSDPRLRAGIISVVLRRHRQAALARSSAGGQTRGGPGSVSMEDRVFPVALDVTVLICTYNRADRLGETLDSLARSRPDPSRPLRWDVIVVDNN